MDNRTHAIGLDGTKEATVTSWRQPSGWYARVEYTTEDGSTVVGPDFGPDQSRSAAESAAVNYHDRSLFMDRLGF